VVRVALVTIAGRTDTSLFEDVPGVGKDLAWPKALARSIDCTVSRIQFTPGTLMPSDSDPAVSIYNRANGGVRIPPPARWFAEHRGRRRDQPGLPKDPVRPCWSAWRNGRSPWDGKTFPPGSAVSWSSRTQNPIEMEGTYSFGPEAPARPVHRGGISVGYPDLNARTGHGSDEHAGARHPMAGPAPGSPMPPRSAS